MNNEKHRELIFKLQEKAALKKIQKMSSEKRSFNETKNDLWILECVFPGKKEGYFLEAGASSGLWASSCYRLEKEMNWSGLCVEPSDVFFEQLVVLRPNSICENVCLSNIAGTVNFIQGEGRPEDPYFSGIKENLEQFKADSSHILQTGKFVQKPAITLENLLDKHGAPDIIDYAAFDIEGSELKVLENFPFERYQFSALSLECDRSMWNSITALLSNNGYNEVGNPFNSDMHWERYWLHKTLSPTYV